MKRIKLVIADVDGTLVTPDKTLTAKACEAVDRLRAAGIQFTITSGRPPRGMAMLVEPLKLTAPIAGFNGGMLTQPDLTTVIEQKVLPSEIAWNVVDYLQRPGFDVWVYCGNNWFIRNASAPHVATEQKTVQIAPTVIRDLHGVLDKAIKIVGVSDDAPLMDRCESELSKRVRGHVFAARSQSYYLDITHVEANKGCVVSQLSRLLGIPTAEIATIGDMPTDVRMFKISGMSIAMGNASPTVQQAAKHVTTSNQDEGFAYAVDHFILKDGVSP